MNLAVSENLCPNSTQRGNMLFSRHNYQLKKVSQAEGSTNRLGKKIKRDQIFKILKIERLSKDHCKHANIEFSKDEALVNRLFSIKGTVMIRKKTFL